MKFYQVRKSGDGQINTPDGTAGRPKKPKSVSSPVYSMATLKQYQFIETLLLQKGISQTDTEKLNQLGISNMEAIPTMSYDQVAHIIKNIKRLKTQHAKPSYPRFRQQD